MYMQFNYLFMYCLSFFIIAVVQSLCVIVCRASVNKDVYILLVRRRSMYSDLYSNVRRLHMQEK